MTSLTEHLHAVTQANSIEEVWTLHLGRMAAYGFDRLLYGYTRFRSANNFGDLRDAIILTNHSPEYMREYLGKGLYAHGPMVRWAADHDGPCSWGYIRKLHEAGELDEKALEVSELNARAGLRAGYTISFKELSTRSGGAIGLCAAEGLSQEDVEEIWARDGADILLINNVSHLKITQLPYTEGRKLTDRQREVLEWVADGKTMQDVACLMGLTPATVEKHLRRAREALDAENTAQAILKASVQNQFFVVPG